MQSGTGTFVPCPAGVETRGVRAHTLVVFASTRQRAPLLLAGLLTLALAVPVVAADPPGQTKDKTKAPEIAVTVSGTVVGTTDAKGRPSFELTAGGTTWELSAGPKWYWGTNNPLAAFVGKTVEVTGTHREGSTDLSVQTIDGAAIRSAGRPPWAGGPKAVGERHPGFKAWKTRGGNGKGKGHGRAGAPGQVKEKPAKGADDEGADPD